MKTTNLHGLECCVLENNQLQILIPRSLGPRILSLRFRGGENLLAELPDFVTERPDGKPYHFYGGHRLWLSPEDPFLTYALDDQEVEISQIDAGLFVRKATEGETGIEKSILVHLDPLQAELTLIHRLTNQNSVPVVYAPWTITQFRTGGRAILPQSQDNTGLLPNRKLSFWPYTDITCPQLILGNRYIFLHAGPQIRFKIGFPNPRKWLAYWWDGILFVKKATYNPQGNYSDFGCSSECYCCNQFLELETLAPLAQIEPNTSVTHTETWHLYPDIPLPENEPAFEALVQDVGLE